MAGDNDWQDKAKSLAVFFGIGCALIGYAGGGPKGAIMGFAAGWGLGYLVALFFRHLAVFIGSGITLIGIVALIVARVGYIEKNVKPKETTGDELPSFESVFASSRKIMFLNKCDYDVSLRLRWRSESHRWQWSGPWVVTAGRAQVLTFPDGTAIEAGDDAAQYLIEPVVPGPASQRPTARSTTMKVYYHGRDESFWDFQPSC